jgi:heme/copper-type cytochrome/quinol oxidase subunit 3
MLERARLGMAMFLLNEAVLFFFLITAFVYFRDSGVMITAQSLNFAAAALYTACLAASGFTMWRAAASAGRDNARAVRAWLGGTILLGAAFLGGQGGEYARLFHQSITISRNLFGTTFFTLTGCHGLHVLIGILLLAIALYLASPGEWNERRSVAVRTVALYWYFVAAVWIAIFSTLYLWTLL